MIFSSVFSLILPILALLAVRIKSALVLFFVAIAINIPFLRIEGIWLSVSDVIFSYTSSISLFSQVASAYYLLCRKQSHDFLTLKISLLFVISGMFFYLGSLNIVPFLNLYLCPRSTLFIALYILAIFALERVFGYIALFILMLHSIFGANIWDYFFDLPSLIFFGFFALFRISKMMYKSS